MADTSANGSIIRYPHLSTWQRDNRRNRGTEGTPGLHGSGNPERQPDKPYPTGCLRHPAPLRSTALEIPQLECRRAGIREWKDAWITVSEFNHDVAEQSFYFDPNAEVLGSFSKGFLAKIAAAFEPFLAQPSARVSRTD
ncbi:hypothetical protein [Rhizobium favelukesii]|uniref:Uncharacterized protein n=1 Tax=Rhizobium favelukesii TaxID=348824 RepID=W6RVP9_9HYPH|nr:hypothetical protein [Rhizobium favelukesii]MCS0461742.1 hypothetical protein [Rhizobium favelukesii]CDM62723.1 hypothetical protein LPU83_pLPU83d_1353 [Rhizobium favelukesii]